MFQAQRRTERRVQIDKKKRQRSIISVSEGPRNLLLFLIPQSWCLCHSHRSSRAPPLAGRSGGQRLGWRTWGGRDARSVERGQWWCLVEPVLPSGVGSRQDRSINLHHTLALLTLGQLRKKLRHLKFFAMLS